MVTLFKKKIGEFMTVTHNYGFQNLKVEMKWHKVTEFIRRGILSCYFKWLKVSLD